MVAFIIIICVLALAIAFFIAAHVVFRSSFTGVRDFSEYEKKFFSHMEKSGLHDAALEMKKCREELSERKSEDVYITSRDGLRLHAKFFGNSSGKTMVLCHGYRSFGEHDFSCACPMYFSLGFNILMIDERAHGGSEGKYICFGTKERFDVCDWCKYVVNRFGAEHKIILGGISMGSTTALLAAALPDMPENLRGVIADCGFVSADAEFRHVLKDRLHLPAFPLLYLTELVCRLRAGFGFRDCSTLDAVKKIKVPVLFIHGEADDFVLPENTEKNYAVCASEKFLVTVPGAGHGMSFLIDGKKCTAALETFLSACKI